MTPAYPPETQPKAVEYAMLLKGFNRIIGARGVKATGRGGDTRNGFLINPNQPYEKALHFFSNPAF
jgi:hypothetical protein